MKTVRRDTATILSLDAEDLERPPQVKAAFDEILSVLQRRAVIVDLRRVARLTSMGLSALSAGADAAREHKARFAIAGVRPEVRHLIESLELDAGGAGGADGTQRGRIEIVEDVELPLADDD